MKSLRQRVVDRMDERDISVRQLAKKLDCHHQTIHKWYWGQSSINSDLLEAILSELGFEIV